jgi:hypothetical protein
MVRSSILSLSLSLCAVLALAFGPAIAMQPVRPPMVNVSRPPRMTYLAPTIYSEAKDGTSFALSTHSEPYQLGRPIYVELWFRTLRPYFSYFNARSGLHFTVVDPRGITLNSSKPISMRAPIEYTDRGVAVIGDDSFGTNLDHQYAFTTAGRYTVAATVTILGVRPDDKVRFTLTSPPISIVIEK